MFKFLNKKAMIIITLLLYTLLMFLCLAPKVSAESNDFKFPSVSLDSNWKYENGTVNYKYGISRSQMFNDSKIVIPLPSNIFKFTDYAYVYHGGTTVFRKQDLANKNKLELILKKYGDYYSLQYLDKINQYGGQLAEISVDAFNPTFMISIEMPKNAINNNGLFDVIDKTSIKWVKNGDYYYYGINQGDYGLIASQTDEDFSNDFAYKFSLPEKHEIQYSSDGSKWITSPLDNVLFAHNLRETYHDEKNGIVSGKQLSSSKKLYIRYKDNNMVIDPTNPGTKFDSVNDLTKTYGKELGTVKFNVDGTTLIVEIDNEGLIKHLKYNMDAKTDMSLFSKTKEAFYINLDGKNPQLFINKSDRLYLKDILSSEKVPAFVPHAIWDLKTNELKSIDTYTAYAFLKQNTKGVMMAYYYTDAFVMDNLISAKLSYTAITQTEGFLGWDKKTTQADYVFDYTSSDTLKYRDFTGQWNYLLGPLSVVFTGVKAINQYEMPRIESVDFNNLRSEYNISRSEIEKEFRSLSTQFDTLKLDKNYKLWAFGLTQGIDWDFGFISKGKTYFYENKDNPKDPKNFKVMEIVYETDGKIYTTVGDDIDLKKKVAEKDDGSLIIQPKFNVLNGIFALLLLALVVFCLSKIGLFSHWVPALITLSLLAVGILILWPTIGDFVGFLFSLRL